MTIIGQTLTTLLWVYLLLMLARLVMDYVRLFARRWTPTGVTLVAFEAVYTVTDPPLRFFRRFIPPLRLGGVALDLSFLIVIILIQILMSVARQL